MDYPELAAHIPAADPLIVELPELFSNCFLIWVPLTDLTTIFFVFNHSSITQHSFFPHGIAIAAYTRKRRDINGVSEIAEDEQSELPFPVGSNTYSERIYTFIRRVREEVDKALSSKRLYLYPNSTMM
jgi:hypothetical protein